MYTSGFTALTSYSWKFDDSAYSKKNHQKLKKIIQQKNDFESKLRNQRIAVIRRLDKNLKEMSWEERVKISNSYLPKYDAPKDKAKDEFERKVVQKIVRLMIKDKTDRDDVVEWIAPKKDDTEYQAKFAGEEP